MRSRLREIENSISQCRNQPQAGKKAAMPKGNMVSKASKLGAPATEFPVNYEVPGDVPTRKQREAAVAWAVAYNIMVSWKLQPKQPISVDNALANVNSKWLDVYNGNVGLTTTQKVEFLAQAGLVSKPLKSARSVDEWENMLRTFGPLWITNEETSGKPWTPHARIVTAVVGDGSAENTTLSFINPKIGQYSKEKIPDFLQAVGTELARAGHKRIQVVHWPKGARLSTGKSYQASNYLTVAGGSAFALPFSADNTSKKAVVEAAPEAPPAKYVDSPAAPTPPAAAAPAAPPATPLPPMDLESAIKDLIAKGADKDALMAFLKELNVPISADAFARAAYGMQVIGTPGITVTVPSAAMLEGDEADVFRVAVGAKLTPVPIVGETLRRLFAHLPAVATDNAVTIGVGPDIEGGLTNESNIGVGIVFAPENKIGYYGDKTQVLDSIAGISGGMRISVVQGAHTNFGGKPLVLPVKVMTDSGAIDAHAMMADTTFKGLTGIVGVSADTSPFVAFAKYQQDPSSAQALSAYADQMAGPLFGIAGLGAVEATEIGLAAIGVAQQAAQPTGQLVWSSDQANRMLTNEARAALGNKKTNPYRYPLLFVGEIKPGFADALFEVLWQGNDYGEIAGLRVETQLKDTTVWSKSSLKIDFKQITTLPPNGVKDPREWPITFGYIGTYDPYGNGYFRFKGQFEASAFGGLKHTEFEISDKSFASWAKIGKPTEYIKRKPGQSYTVPKLPADQLAFLKKKLGERR